MTATTAIPPARVRAWDRAAIGLLGAAGTALSYDALQQMATAIHVREPLTYLFPLVIDGFIAYGVRALIVLRTAPFPARLYVWTLFGTATATSIWANALHAVRLNQQLTTHTGLRLGDTTVGTLSTVAPLALAGAVHHYILIARHSTNPSTPGHATSDHGILTTPPSPQTDDRDQPPAPEPGPSPSQAQLSPVGTPPPDTDPSATAADERTTRPRRPTASRPGASGPAARQAPSSTNSSTSAGGPPPNRERSPARSSSTRSASTASPSAESA